MPLFQLAVRPASGPRRPVRFPSFPGRPHRHVHPARPARRRRAVAVPSSTPFHRLPPGARWNSPRGERGRGARDFCCAAAHRPATRPEGASGAGRPAGSFAATGRTRPRRKRCAAHGGEGGTRRDPTRSAGGQFRRVSFDRCPELAPWGRAAPAAFSPSHGRTHASCPGSSSPRDHPSDAATFFL